MELIRTLMVCNANKLVQTGTEQTKGFLGKIKKKKKM